MPLVVSTTKQDRFCHLFSKLSHLQLNSERLGFRYLPNALVSKIRTVEWRMDQNLWGIRCACVVQRYFFLFIFLWCQVILDNVRERTKNVYSFKVYIKKKIFINTVYWVAKHGDVKWSQYVWCPCRGKRTVVSSQHWVVEQKRSLYMAPCCSQCGRTIFHQVGSHFMSFNGLYVHLNDRIVRADIKLVFLFVCFWSWRTTLNTSFLQISFDWAVVF